uniref:AT-hook motif nuclear-localized protein n=1 Tax=Kalanchoe fedtschenkoi TaxID=63787 RepID=A0A7N0VGY3_KALFE
MDDREAMSSSYGGSSQYYMQQRGVSVAVPGTHSSGLSDSALEFRHGLNQGSVLQSCGHGPAFQVDSLNSNYHQNVNIGSSSGTAQGEVVKRKRGRPRKYVPDQSVALVLSPMSEKASQGSITASEKRKRGRPPGTGRKQKLASLGGWMNSSAGVAFAPHVLIIAAGEDVASKVLQLSHQRPRALCIMSGSGVISSASLRQPASSSSIFTYEGHFQILCLSGSYLVSEEGGSNKRTGGLNISLSSPEGHVFGGVIGGPLVAASPVQVVTCSFVYDSSKSKMKDEEPLKPLKYEQEEGEPSTPANSRPNQNLTPTIARNSWPSSQALDVRNPHTGIDLMLG